MRSPSAPVLERLTNHPDHKGNKTNQSSML